MFGTVVLTLLVMSFATTGEVRDSLVTIGSSDFLVLLKPVTWSFAALIIGRSLFALMVVVSFVARLGCTFDALSRRLWFFVVIRFLFLSTSLRIVLA